jgi:hypothetical protein
LYLLPASAQRFNQQRIAAAELRWLAGSFERGELTWPELVELTRPLDRRLGV